MKKIILNGSLSLILFFCAAPFFSAMAQKVDTLAYKDGTKISETAYWKVGEKYHAETWFSKNVKGTASLATFGSNSFQIDWDIKEYGFLHEVGLYNLNIPADSINPKAKSKYSHTFSNVTDSGGYTGLYGWFGKAGTPDCIEFYINENWVGKPAIGTGDVIKKGTITVDGATYDIYTRPRRGDIWAQWWSNRTSPSTEGTISYAKHIQEWRKLGLPEINLTRLTYAFECTWGFPTGGSLKYNYFEIDEP